MDFRPETIEEWCHLVPNVFREDAWQTVLHRDSSTFSVRDCPWGGKLVKFTFEDMVVENPPEDPANTMLRPEVRAWGARRYLQIIPEERSPESVEVDEICAPGDVVLSRKADWSFLRLCSVLLGELHELTENHFFDPEMPGKFRQRLRRNYPQPGDSSHSVISLSAPFEILSLCRPQKPGVVTMHHIFRSVNGFPLADWASPHLLRLLETGRRTSHFGLNRPGAPAMREMDARCYITLTMQSFKRGRPFVPVPARAGEASDSEQVTQIDAGESMGLATWIRYHPQMVGKRGFRLSDYLRLFMERIGEGQKLTIYDTLDGQQVVPYQCVVLREEWLRVQDHFDCAYRVQKAAYRRANGGSCAPGIMPSVAPRLCQEVSLSSLEARLKQARCLPKIQVRKTFVELVEGGDDAQPRKGAKCHRRQRSVFGDILALLAARGQEVSPLRVAPWVSVGE